MKVNKRSGESGYCPERLGREMHCRHRMLYGRWHFGNADRFPSRCYWKREICFVVTSKAENLNINILIELFPPPEKNKQTKTNSIAVILCDRCWELNAGLSLPCTWCRRWSCQGVPGSHSACIHPDLLQAGHRSFLCRTGKSQKQRLCIANMLEENQHLGLEKNWTGVQRA